MPSPQEYRGHAMECLRLAQQAADPADKARLLQMAQSWQDLADKLEANEGASGDSDQ